MSRPVVLVLALLISAGCKPHVTLKAPAPNLSAAERVQFFEDHRAVFERKVTTTSCGNAGCTTQIDRTLRLADGREVHHVEDLLPVLGPHSDSARAVRAATSARSKARWTKLPFVASLGLVMYGTLSVMGTEDLTPTTNQKVLIGVGVVGAIGSMIAGWIYSRRFNSNAARANRMYNDGLADTLKVCVVGVRVVPCEEVLPGAAGF